MSGLSQVMWPWWRRDSLAGELVSVVTDILMISPE